MRILNEMKEMEKDISVSQLAQSDQTSTPIQPSKKIKLDVFAFIKEQELTISGSEITELTKIDQEFDSYLKESVIMDKIDVFKWWKENKNKYPNLYELAIKYLCIPATSVPSERIFSKAGEIMSKKRNRISVKHMKNLIFFNHNF